MSPSSSRQSTQKTVASSSNKARIVSLLADSKTAVTRLIFIKGERRLTTKLNDSRRRAPVERRGEHRISRDSQTESAAAVGCSALVRPRPHFFAFEAG